MDTGRRKSKHASTPFYSDLTTHGLLDAEVSGAAAGAVTCCPVVLSRAEAAHFRCGVHVTQMTAAEN